MARVKKIDLLLRIPVHVAHQTHHDSQDDRQGRNEHRGGIQGNGFCGPEDGDKREHGQAVLLLGLGEDLNNKRNGR